jgi:histidine ammonia-lyase
MFKLGIDHLTAGLALAIARGAEDIEISDVARENVKASEAIVAEIAAGDRTVYGINTGFGPLCDTKISPKDTKELQRKILLSHSVGTGEPISKELSKLMLILKAHALCKGFSGVSEAVVDRIVFQIKNDIIPVVPKQGSVGASGDLAPLSHLFLPLLGEGYVWGEEGRIPAGNVLSKNGLKPVSLGAKDGLALINGTQFIASHAVQLVERMYKVLSHADISAAMMVEGLKGSEMPFNAQLHETRPHIGNVHVASRVRALLKDSAIVVSHKNCDKVQDPYSLRCVPQVHGTSRNAWLHLKETLEVEINSVTDNPIVFSTDLTISGGNFHGQPMALPIDYAGLACSEIGNISDRRAYLALEGKYEGTPRLLMDSGFMILQYTTAALASENKGLCWPASADSIPTSMGQEDHVSMGSISGRRANEICGNVEQILAIELMFAAQAYDFRKKDGLKGSSVMEELHSEIRKHVAFASEDRIFGDDIEKMVALVRSGELLELTKMVRDESAFSELFESF